MANASVRIIRNFKLPKEPGSYHRLVCMTGKNKGLSYFISNKRVIFGRSDKADIQVLDTKSSREHAELALINGDYILSDLGSQNGVVVNDLKVSQHTLSNNDKIIIGSTVFKYNEVIVESEALIEVDEEDDDEDEEEERKKNLRKNRNKKSSTDEAAKKKRIYILVGTLLLLFLFLDEGDEKNGKKKKKNAPVKKSSIETSFRAPYSASSLDKETKIKLSSIIHRGRRELREQNFFRAIEQFSLALILDPGNGQASFLYKKSQQSLDEYIKKMKYKAENEQSQLKYKGALIQWCEIIRYLRDYPKDERYTMAENQVEFLEQKMGMDKGEHKCF